MPWKKQKQTLTSEFRTSGPTFFFSRIGSKSMVPVCTPQSHRAVPSNSIVERQAGEDANTLTRWASKNSTDRLPLTTRPNPKLWDQSTSPTCQWNVFYANCLLVNFMDFFKTYLHTSTVSLESASESSFVTCEALNRQSTNLQRITKKTSIGHCDACPSHFPSLKSEIPSLELAGMFWNFIPCRNSVVYKRFSLRNT